MKVLLNCKATLVCLAFLGDRGPYFVILNEAVLGLLAATSLREILLPMVCPWASRLLSWTIKLGGLGVWIAVLVIFAISFTS